MDELTRERFWSTRLPDPEVEARRRVLLGLDDDAADQVDEAAAMQQARIRAAALTRNRSLAASIRAYEVKSA